MNTELEKYIVELQTHEMELYKNYTGSEFEKGQLSQLEDILERLIKIVSV